ncbi:Protein Smaug like protein 1 [Tupaia chinensis]|uniref:Protein Smaug like protein 1 n=1 Tax=Tupaia chinensis TaxID=246437 RepID=L9JDK1_TUPCH|nr:Protein Smaug like protein 1 [Tupaia chinensis]
MIKPIFQRTFWQRGEQPFLLSGNSSQRERQHGGGRPIPTLTELSSDLQDIIEGGSLRIPLQELHQMILTPIKAYSSPSTTPEAHRREPPASHPPSLMGPENQSLDCKDSTAATGATATPPAGASGGLQPHQLSSCDGELAVAPLPEGDLPGQFTRVMGKVCTQLLVSRPDEENISSYLQLIDKCLIHEAFTETQKKRLLSWKQQVQKLFRSFPRKTLLDISGYRQQRNRGFGQSNSLPTAGSVGGGMGRRNPRQYQIPSRNVPSARLGLLGTSGFVSTNQRNTTANPAIMKQGRQNLWFANPGGSNSMPSRTHSSVQRTRSLPVHTSPQNMLMFQQPGSRLVDRTLPCAVATETPRAYKATRAILPCLDSSSPRGQTRVYHTCRKYHLGPGKHTEQEVLEESKEGNVTVDWGSQGSFLELELGFKGLRVKR